MKSPLRRVAAALALFAPLAAYAQTRGVSLVALTMNTGTVLIAEVVYESETELKVVNLDTGVPETFPKAKDYKKLSPTEAKLLGRKFTVTGKRPERLEAVQAEDLVANTPELFKRLGNYPENLAKYVAWSARKVGDGKPTVAVLPLQDTRGQRTGETTRRAEELTGALARRGVDVVERARLDQVVGELVKQQGVLFDDSVAQQVGRQVGASAVVVGSLSPRGDKADMNLRLVEVATGRILDAPTLTDIAGLPRERMSVAAGPSLPSFVGRWEFQGEGGRKGMMTVHPNKTLTLANGARGRWDQTGLDITVFLPRPGPATPKKQAAPPVIKFVGQLGPGGQRFRAVNEAGNVVNGTRL